MADPGKWKSYGEWCSANNCNNNRKNCKGLGFFRFPTQQERYEINLLYNTHTVKLQILCKHI